VTLEETDLPEVFITFPGYFHTHTELSLTAFSEYDVVLAYDNVYLPVQSVYSDENLVSWACTHSRSNINFIHTK
jgi:hypothetical protein